MTHEHELVDKLDGILERALAAVRLELRRLEPILAGLHDYERLDVHADTLDAVVAAIALYEQRIALLKIAEGALEALLGLVLGATRSQAALDEALRTAPASLRYQPIKLPPVTQAVYDDLADQQRTITAAFGEFEAEPEASTIEIEWGKPEDQPKATGE